MDINDKNRIRLYNKAILKNSLVLVGSAAVGVASVGGIVFNGIEGTLDMTGFTLCLATGLVSFGIAYTCGYNIGEYIRYKQKIKKNRR